MSLTSLCFNLLVNSIFSLAAGLLIVKFSIWLFRVETGSWKLFLLSLPFAKIVYDCVRGIPEHSILLTGLDPFELPPLHQAIRLGAGFNIFGPYIQATFAVRDEMGRIFSSSIGDYVLIWIEKNLGGHVPMAALGLALFVAVVLTGHRIRQVFRFERQRRQDRLYSKSLKTVRLGSRSVDIYISESFSGTPFTGGIFRPYICIPRDAFDLLETSEVASVLAHELGHIQKNDLLGTMLIQTLGDLFWFVPGYRLLSRKIDGLREVVADQWAVKAGADPFALASSLVKLREIPEVPANGVLYSAFFRSGSLLEERVRRLTGDLREGRPRFGWGRRWFKVVFSIWIFSAVMVATLGGNA